MSNTPTHLEERIQKEYPVLNIEDNGYYPVGNAAYKLAQKAARFGVKIALEEQLVKCSDRMPNEKTNVLALSTFGRFIETDWEQFTSRDKEWFLSHYTHWMPLPPKPKE